MKPAIFNTAMVRAIIALIKTNTRRPFSKYLQTEIVDAWVKGKITTTGKASDFTESDIKYLMAFAPYQVGYIIYVRETWSDTDPKNGEKIEPVYKANAPFEYGEIDAKNWFTSDEVKWKPSIHMPKEYARLFLRVKDVRIERLNEISEEDAEAEGLECIEFQGGAEYRTLYGIGVDEQNGKFISDSPKESFKELWESIYGKDSFDNRYVWVIEFERISKEETTSETAT